MTYTEAIIYLELGQCIYNLLKIIFPKIYLKITTVL